MLQLLSLAKRSAVSSPLLPTCQASANFSNRLGVRGLSTETVMEIGRQGSQCSAAMLCAIFHCYDCCCSIINVIHIALFLFHLDWTHFCSLCAILLQCRVVQKHLQRKLLIDHLLDLPLLRSQSKSSLGTSGAVLCLQSWIKLEVFVMLSALETLAEWACDWQ